MTDGNDNLKKYYAFISYRHADNKEQGRQWASWLHQALETYEVPADLAGKQNARGDVIPPRIYPIFRDEEELPAHADLGHSIVRALEDSQLLIVLCSPRAVASTYVADEIAYFKKLGHSERIIAALIDGEPNASWDKGKQQAGFSQSDECFPTPLQFEYDSEGSQTDKHAEPIAADFRINNNGTAEQGWTSPGAYRQHLKSNSQLDNAEIDKKVSAYQQQQQLMLLKIIAGILGVPLGELTQRDKAYQLAQQQQKAKRLRQWLAGVAALAIMAIGAGVFAYFQREEAIANESFAIQSAAEALQQKQLAETNLLLAQNKTKEAQTSQSAFLATQAREQNDASNYDIAMLLALNALPGPYGGDRPYSVVAADQLYRSAVNQHKQIQIVHENPKNYYLPSSYVVKVAYSHDGKHIFTASNAYNASVWNRYNLNQVHHFPQPSGGLMSDLDQVKSKFGGEPAKVFLINENNNIDIHLAETGKHITTIPLLSLDKVTRQDSPLFAIADKGSQLATIQNKELLLWNTDNGHLLEKISLTALRTDVKHVQVSEDGLLIGMATSKSLWLWQKTTGLVKLATSKGSILPFKISKDGAVVFSTSYGVFRAPLSDTSPIKIHPAINLIRSITTSTNGELILLHARESVTIVNLENQHSRSIAFDRIIKSAQLSPDGKTFAVILHDNRDDTYKKLVLYDTATGLPLKVMLQNTSVNDISFSPDSHALLAASKNLAVEWRTDIGTSRNYLPKVATADSLILNKTGNAMLALTDEKLQLLRYTESDEWREILIIPSIQQARFSPSGNYFWTLDNDDNLSIIRVSDASEIATASNVVTLEWGLVTLIKFSSDEKTFLTTDGLQYTLARVDGGAIIGRFTPYPEQQMLRAAAIIDNTRVALGNENNTSITVWDTTTGTTNWQLVFDNDQQIHFLKSDLENDLLVSTGNWLYKIDSNNGETLNKIDFGSRNVSYISALPDKRGYYAVLTSEGLVQLEFLDNDFNLIIDKSEVIDDGGSEPNYAYISDENIAFTDDGTSMLLKSAFETELWSLDNFTLLQTFPFVERDMVIALGKEHVMFASPSDGVLKFQYLNKADIVSLAIRKLPWTGKCLSDEQRRQFSLNPWSDKDKLRLLCK